MQKIRSEKTERRAAHACLLASEMRREFVAASAQPSTRTHRSGVNAMTLSPLARKSPALYDFRTGMAIAVQQLLRSKEAA